ncbi:aminoglycoside phosphotransferase family protein [Candidatus Saccharibacteria bacterium]|jgi:aminoglycoside 2''-phosphotransferase|nr:aminoglycoside phosphotransferase family protein [Candidatus Saccharibacteria bacterium]
MDAKVMPAPVEDYQKLIEQDFPDFKVQEIKYLGSGWDNAALLVNQQFVFRFPRGLFEQSERLKTDEIEKEVDILRYLQGKVPFNVPKPQFVAPGFRYFGYMLLEGQLWDQVDSSQQFSDRFLQSWVEVRSQISSSIPSSEYANLKIPSYRTDKNQKLVEGYIADEAGDIRVRELAQKARDYILDHLTSNTSWVFIHEDLQQSNCFVDAKTNRITGVIDWGEAEIGPVEAEFYFWSKWGKPMLERVAKMQQIHDGTQVNIELARSIHIFYIVADYVDFTKRGYNESAQRKWHQIEQYLHEDL